MNTEKHGQGTNITKNPRAPVFFRVLFSHLHKSGKREDATELLATTWLYSWHCDARSAGHHLI